MGNVVSLLGYKTKCKSKEFVEERFEKKLDLEENTYYNKQQRLKKEREESNKKVLKSYNLRRK